MKQVLALVLALCVLLCGCVSVADLLSVDYGDMEYTRPDLEELERVLQESCAIARKSRDIDEVEDAIWEYYDAYDWFYTNHDLAYLHYCHDVTDAYWEEEYRFCADNYYIVDAGLEELYMALAQSPIRDQLETEAYFGEGYFDAYEGESFYDDAIMTMLEQENELVNRYYDLYEQSLDAEYYSESYFSTYADPMCQVLAELVILRQDMADYMGYDDYAEFCYDYYYYRDYTWQEAQKYLQQIQAELVPLYQQVNNSNVWDFGWRDCNEAESLEHLRSAAQSMGGSVAEAFELLDTAGLYDIRYGPNKYDASFEVYLTSYYEPFIFMNPSLTQWDKLTLVHEFGHFVNDYVSYGSYAGIDVAEVFSQGMEYLSLCYVEDEKLEELKLADCLCIYVEQAAYASFEHQLYQLEDVTADSIFALYRQVGLAYGFDEADWDPRDLITITHLYTNPMYLVSYVVSNDAAFQLYRMEKEEPGAGLALYESQLDTGESYFLAFLEDAGLESPFAPGRIQVVKQTLESILG